MVSPRAPLIGPGPQEQPSDGAQIAFLEKVSTFPVLWNGNVWNRQRANTQFTLLASAVRSANLNSADVVNFNCAAVGLFWDITAVPGVDTVTMQVQFKDPVSETYVGGFVSAALATTGLRYFGLGRGDVDGGGAEITVPVIFRVAIVHSGIGDFTYSLGGVIVN